MAVGQQKYSENELLDFFKILGQRQPIGRRIEKKAVG
jgi:hypothetical protein